MGERISFSPELLEFEQVAVSHSDLEKGVLPESLYLSEENVV
jgi:hypothetical protein